MLDNARPEPVRSPALDACESEGIRHGFFTRQGGVSSGLFRGLNVGLGSGDDRSAIRENRQRVARWMGVEPERLVGVHQVHSPDVVAVDRPFVGDRPRADAMVTDRPGLALGVLTADCGPILFSDAGAGVIGAAHAGWQGALTGVLENTIAAMERLGARSARIVAVLGPSISQENYEVGPEFVERFRASDPASERFFVPSARAGHALFDLRGYTLARLERAGIEAASVPHCTYALESEFYSYRRATHRNEPDYGRQVSAIVMENR
ncbi:MAG: peptidoglycan editing factor PgeF [Rhizobiaceae bacterium]